MPQPSNWSSGDGAIWLGINLPAAFLAAWVIGQFEATVEQVVPLLLKRFHVDPALAGSVVVTTVTDCVGFFAFLGLGTLRLLR